VAPACRCQQEKCPLFWEKTAPPPPPADLQFVARRRVAADRCAFIAQVIFTPANRTKVLNEGLAPTMWHYRSCQRGLHQKTGLLNPTANMVESSVHIYPMCLPWGRKFTIRAIPAFSIPYWPWLRPDCAISSVSAGKPTRGEEPAMVSPPSRDLGDPMAVLREHLGELFATKASCCSFSGPAADRDFGLFHVMGTTPTKPNLRVQLDHDETRAVSQDPSGALRSSTTLRGRLARHLGWLTVNSPATRRPHPAHRAAEPLCWKEADARFVLQNSPTLGLDDGDEGDRSRPDSVLKGGHAATRRWPRAAAPELNRLLWLVPSDGHGRIGLTAVIQVYAKTGAGPVTPGTASCR